MIDVEKDQTATTYPNDTSPEQIEALIEGAASLQKQILRRYTQSVLEEMRYHLWIAQEKCKMFEKDQQAVARAAAEDMRERLIAKFDGEHREWWTPEIVETIRALPLEEK